MGNVLVVRGWVSSRVRNRMGGMMTDWQIAIVVMALFIILQDFERMGRKR